MRLTQFTEYALRLLLFAATHSDRRITVGEAAGAYDVSRAHLMKVANHLVKAGFLKSVRGRTGGGLFLSRPPETITLGEIVRSTEPALSTLECFGEAEVAAAPGLALWRGALWRASEAFLAHLDSLTLAELTSPPARPRRSKGALA